MVYNWHMQFMRFGGLQLAYPDGHTPLVPESFQIFQATSRAGPPFCDGHAKVHVKCGVGASNHQGRPRKDSKQPRSPG